MITRHVGSQTFNFSYDAENRLVTVSGDETASFVFDGDGKRVVSTMDGATTIFVGGHYEKVGTSITKYYMAGASRVAMRKDGTVSYLLADHLGSSSTSTDANGVRTSELRYKAWGETRYSFGTMPTRYTFTGQYMYTDDPSTPGSEGFGLMYFGARWVDPQLGRFVQADTMIPGSVQGFDRYAYSNNSPLKYTDPSGHFPILPFLIAAVIMVLTSCDVAPAQSQGPTQRQSEIQNLIDNKDYNGAINAAEELYGINPIAPIKYTTEKDENGDPINGRTSLLYGNSVLGEEAFQSADYLVAAVAHEAIHQDQLFNSRWYLNDEGGVLNEIEALDRIINRKDELELSPSTIKSYTDRLNLQLKLLQWLRSDLYLKLINPGSGDEDNIYNCDDCPVAPTPAQ